MVKGVEPFETHYIPWLEATAEGKLSVAVIFQYNVMPCKLQSIYACSTSVEAFAHQLFTCSSTVQAVTFVDLTNARLASLCVTIFCFGNRLA